MGMFDTVSLHSLHVLQTYSEIRVLRLWATFNDKLIADVPIALSENEDTSS